MEKSRGNSSKMIKNPKTKPSSSSSSENISPMRLEIDDPIFIGRGRFQNPMMPLSPTFLSYAENLNINSPLALYLRGGGGGNGGGSPISGKLSPSGESFMSPVANVRKSRSAIVQMYGSGGSSGSSGSSSGGGRRLSVCCSPLSSIENLEMMTSPVYGTPVKTEEETLVIDDIQVRLSSSGGGKRLMADIPKKYSNGKESRSNGKEPRSTRLSNSQKSESSKSSPGAGPSVWGPRNRNYRQFLQNPAGLEDAVKTQNPAPPAQPKPEPDHALIARYTTTLFNDWSPLDDYILTVAPQSSASKNSLSREDIDGYISRVLFWPSPKPRLPAFVELCSEKPPPRLKGPRATRR